MDTANARKQSLLLADVRGILTDDFQKNEIDRIVMALKPCMLERTSFELHEVRTMLADDFSPSIIGRVLMTLKLSQRLES